MLAGNLIIGQASTGFESDQCLKRQLTVGIASKLLASVAVIEFVIKRR